MAEEKNISLSKITEDKIYKYIIDTPLEIGEKLPSEFELVNLFHVGRGTIREAIKALSSKGIVVAKKGSGIYVINKSIESSSDPLGLSEFDDEFKLAIDLSDVRLMIEPELCALAAQYATEDEKSELVRLCDRVEQLYRAGKNHLVADVEFHKFIAQMSRNRVVVNLIPIITKSVIIFGNLTKRKLMEETLITHRQVTDAIRHNDAIGARSAMVMHLNYNRQELFKIFKK